MNWPDLEDNNIARSISEVLARGALSGIGQYECTNFEAELSEYFGIPFTVTTASGTVSIEAALFALNLEPNSEVILPCYTFGATAQAIINIGLIPVFVEINPITYCIDAKAIGRAVTESTKAVIVVHIHGTPCNMSDISKVCREYHLPIIEDAAQAHGAKWGNSYVGTIGDIGCFSLQSSKHVPAGEGGFTITEDIGLSERIRLYTNLGLSTRTEEAFENGVTYFREHVSKGTMGRLSEIPAAIGRVSLSMLDNRLHQLQENITLIISAIDESGLFEPINRNDETSYQVWHKLRVKMSSNWIDRFPEAHEAEKDLRSKLSSVGISSSKWQSPILPLHPYYCKDSDQGYWLQSKSHEVIEQSFILFDETSPLISLDKVSAQNIAESISNISK